MNWYYDGGAGQRQGPVDDSTFEELIAAGTITPQTLVWHQGMKDWAPLSQVRDTTPRSSIVPETERCDVCGNFVPVTELIEIGDRKSVWEFVVDVEANITATEHGGDDGRRNVQILVENALPGSES